MSVDEIEWIKCGPRYAVGITRAARKEFEKADARDRARILRFMAKYAEDGRENLGDDKLKFEQRFKIGAKRGNVPIFAWRANQARVYGSEVGVEKRTIFLCTEATVKKQNKADMKILKSAAEKFVKIVDAIKGKQSR